MQDIAKLYRKLRTISEWSRGEDATRRTTSKERWCTTRRRRNEYWSSSPGQDAPTTLLDRRRPGARLFGYSGTTEKLFRLTFPAMLFGFRKQRRDEQRRWNIRRPDFEARNSILFTQHKLAFCQTALFRVLNRLKTYEFIVQIYVHLAFQWCMKIVQI